MVSLWTPLFANTLSHVLVAFFWLCMHVAEGSGTSRVRRKRQGNWQRQRPGRTVLPEGFPPPPPVLLIQDAHTLSLWVYLCPASVLNNLSSACSPACYAVSPKVNSVPVLTGFCFFETFIISAESLGFSALLVRRRGLPVLIQSPRSSC